MSSSSKSETEEPRTLNETNLDELLNIFNNTDFSDLLSAIAYKGFDPMEFRGTTQNKLSDQHIRACVLYGLTGGNQINKMLQHSPRTDNFKLFEEAVRTAKIKSTPSSPESPTLSRFLIAFPEVTALILQVKPSLPTRVPLAKLQEITNYSKYPSIARHHSCATLIPSSLKEFKIALDVIMLPKMLDEQAVINRSKAKRELDKEDFNQMMIYIKKSYSSKIFDDTQREHLAENFGITHNGKLSETWQQAGHIAVRILRSKYSTCMADQQL